MSTDAVWPTRADRVVLPVVDSTMSEAARRAPGLTRPLWILALDQTAARGRRGRPWHHPKGNFAATLVQPADRPVTELSLTSFLAALALFDTLAEFVAPARLALKWPNDVLLDGGKVAGILLESGGAKGRIDWLMVGIGINLAHAPTPDQVEPGAVAPVALSDTPPAPETVLTHLAHHFDRHDQTWRTAGFAPLRQLWLSRAARLGQVITARLPDQQITGVFDTVDQDGYLILRTPQGSRKIAAAEVFF